MTGFYISSILAAVASTTALLIAPFEVPGTILKDQLARNSQEKRGWGKMLISVMCAYGILVIQSMYMDAILPNRSRELDELVTQVLGGQDYSVILVLWRLIKIGGFGGTDGFITTIIINGVSILFTAAMCSAGGLLGLNPFTKKGAVARPFDNPVIFALVFIFFVFHTVNTGNPHDSFGKIILKQIFGMLDKVNLVSSVGGMIGMLLPVKIGSLVIKVTKARHLNPVNRI